MHIKLLGDAPVGSGTLGEARIGARYLGKYLTKGGADTPGGLHRYEVAEGFQPRAVPLVAATADGALARASERMGQRPARVWRSSEVAEWPWAGAVWAQWDW